MSILDSFANFLFLSKEIHSIDRVANGSRIVLHCIMGHGSTNNELIACLRDRVIAWDREIEGL